MNDDHADSIADYARMYGALEEVQSARMLALDPQAMELSIEAAGEQLVRRIAFDHVLQDTEDARRTLVEMARQAGSATH